MTHGESAETKDNDDRDESRVEVTFENQLDKFLTETLLTDDEIETFYEPVRQEIHRIFRFTFPRCITRCFGSTVSGLGVKNSDLDIYFCPGVAVISDDSISGPHVIKFQRLFYIVKHILYRYPKLFTRIVPIYAAKVPIIKFVYKPTNISCDLSFSTCLGIYNTQLIRTYMFSDAKFLPTMLIIKLWINQTDLKIRMTKYALAMLFIFYLQQLKLVPAVTVLKESLEVPFFIRDCQIYRNSGAQNLRAKRTSKRIPELLYGFFDYYSKYDFENNIICVNDGKSHDRKVLTNNRNVTLNALLVASYEKVSEDIDLLTWAMPMGIQDVFELNVNVARNMKEGHVKNFQAYCSATAKIIKNLSSNNYINLLDKIFDLKQNFQKEQIIKQIRKPLTFIFEIPVKVLSEKYLEDSNNRNTLFDEVFDFTKIFLEQVLFIKVDLIYDNKELDEYNLESATSDPIQTEQNVTTLRCKGFHQMWVNREKDIYTNNLVNALEKDIIVSKAMLEKSNKKNEKVVVDFICQFIRIINENRLKVNFKIYNYGCTEKIFHGLVQFLNLKMTSVIKKTLNIKHHFENVGKKKKKVVK